jgi:hypothetical protein
MLLFLWVQLKSLSNIPPPLVAPTLIIRRCSNTGASRARQTRPCRKPWDVVCERLWRGLHGSYEAGKTDKVSSRNWKPKTDPLWETSLEISLFASIRKVISGLEEGGRIFFVSMIWNGCYFMKFWYEAAHVFFVYRFIVHSTINLQEKCTFFIFNETFAVAVSFDDWRNSLFHCSMD